MTQTQLDARSISSGTMATLTGLRRYDELDKAQWSFIQFVDAHALDFKNWIVAWLEFSSSFGVGNK